MNAAASAVAVATPAAMPKVKGSRTDTPYTRLRKTFEAPAANSNPMMTPQSDKLMAGMVAVFKIIPGDAPSAMRS
jgi:hypothetical protein